MEKYLSRLFSKKLLSKDELYIRDIIDSYLEDVSVQKLADVLKDDYYILDVVNKISIRLSYGKIEIANHDFLYRKDIGTSFSQTLINKILKRISLDIETTKKELFKNEIDLLRSVFKKIDVK